MRTLLLFIPIGILGLIRWTSWLFRRLPAVLYRPYPEGHSEPITVVTPVYQEDPEIFRAAVGSWLANPEVHEVIAVVDATDTTCIAVARQLAAVSTVTLIVTDVPGKRDALRRGWEAANTEIVALVDSDTVWADDVAARVVEPFDDPEVGGVGTRQNVLNPETLWQRLNDFYLDSRYFDEVAGQTQWGQAVSCLSGRTAVYRRSLLLEISHDFMTETFMGVPCNSGEDKRLTMLTLRKGYKTWMQQNARVWSTFPRGMRTFFRQRMRWARNTWRSDLRALREGWVFRHRWLALSMLDKAVSSFTLLVAPVFMVVALGTRHFMVALALGVWWLVSRGVKYLPHLQRRPLDALMLPAFILVTFVVAALKIVALCSIRRQRWLTRDVAVVDGLVVRVGDGGSGRAPAGASRRRWALGGIVAVAVATALGGVGLAQVQPPREAGFEEQALAATAPGGAPVPTAPAVPPPPAAAPMTVAAAVAPTSGPAGPTAAGPAAPTPVAPAGPAAPTPDAPGRGLAASAAKDQPHCSDPAAPRQPHSGASIATGRSSARDLQAYSPFRMRQTGCAFPPEYRAIMLDAGAVRLVQGGAVVATVQPAGPTYTLEQVRRLVADDGWLAAAEGVYDLKAALIQGEGTTLVVAAPEVVDLRMHDLPHVFLGGQRAQVDFSGVRVTSWSPALGQVDEDHVDGRPFVLYEDESIFNITDSSFDHLGADRSGAYGLVWRSGSRGDVRDLVSTRNFFGMYSYEAVDLSFTDSSFTDNVFYGADPHDRSRRLTFTRNTFENNGSHGAIVSKSVTDIRFVGNTSRGNGGNGIVVDADSSGIVIEENVVAGNAIDGIVLLNSQRNEVINNIVRNNRVGIRINGERSTDNLVQGNTVEGNHMGIQLFGGARSSTITGVVVRGSESIGIAVDAPATKLVNPDVSGGRIGIDLRSPASIEGGAVVGVQVGVAVRSPEPVSITRITITAEQIGVRVDRLSAASMSASTVSAPQPYKGSEQILRGDDLVVRTLAPPGLHWFGVFGFSFLALGLILEGVRRIRTRARPPGGNPPAIVRTNDI